MGTYSIDGAITHSLKKFDDFADKCEETLKGCAEARIKENHNGLVGSIHKDKVSEVAYVVGTDLEYAKYVNWGRGEVKPINAGALWWDGLKHPVPRAKAFGGYHFLEEAVAKLGG